jgi:hypothetical protein
VASACDTASSLSKSESAGPWHDFLLEQDVLKGKGDRCHYRWIDTCRRCIEATITVANITLHIDRAVNLRLLGLDSHRARR